MKTEQILWDSISGQVQKFTQFFQVTNKPSTILNKLPDRTRMCHINSYNAESGSNDNQTIALLHFSLYNKLLQFEKFSSKCKVANALGSGLSCLQSREVENSCATFSIKPCSRSGDGGIESKCKFSLFVSPLTFSKIMNMYIPGHVQMVESSQATLELSPKSAIYSK